MSPLSRRTLIATLLTAALVPLALVLPAACQPATGSAASAASVSGKVILEGRSRHNGVYVTLDRGDGGTVETTPDGRFAFSNTILGWHILRLDMPRYLAVEGRFLASQDVTVLGDLVMLGGDAYGDNIIDILDLALVARHYGGEPPDDARADINDDGAVTIYDLVLVAKNYDREGPTDGQNPAVTALPRSLSAVARERPVVVQKAPDPTDPRAAWTLTPARAAYRVGERVTATLTVDEARPVYGADVRQPYNAKQLRPRDAEPRTPQVEARVGSLFPFYGFAPANRVEQGMLRLAVAQVGGLPRPVSGSILTATFEVIGCGETTFDPRGHLRLTDGRANVIPFNTGAPATLRTACP